MRRSGPICREELRHERVRKSPLFGLDYVEIEDDPRHLRVVFLGAAPPDIDEHNVRITGGRRITDVRAKKARVTYHRDPRLRHYDPERDDFMIVEVDEPGDFSSYTLRIVEHDDRGNPTDQPFRHFDPRYASVEFSFKAGCPSDLDCRATPVCPEPERARPTISYLAKDYTSFRQLILDRLAVLIPEWHERHVPDIGIALVEVLAYVGDHLSYYQDAVATEAYLGTARQRISVRRHARLVDYVMHEGCNARAWVTLATGEIQEVLDYGDIFFVTRFPGAPEDQHVLGAVQIPVEARGTYEIFEPVALGAASITIFAAHTEMHFYTWGDEQCCLPVGTTAATLMDPGGLEALHLQVGDVLVLEEVMGPRTGNPADADPRHRQAVRLTKVTPARDPLGNQALVEIAWGPEDALTFPLCLSSRADMDDCRPLANVSVARGNVVLVDHGGRVETDIDDPCAPLEYLGEVATASTTLRCPTECDPGDVVVAAKPFRPSLQKTPLTFVRPIPPCASARALTDADPRQATAAIALYATRKTTRGDVASAWTPRPDLLASAAGDAHFVVEVDNQGVAHLRFGDGTFGRMPEAETRFCASYRVGNGVAGNVGAERIAYLVYRHSLFRDDDIAPRNPLPASGGIDPEPVVEVKQFAPTAFRKVLQRAITAEDYATLATDNARRHAERTAHLDAATAPADCPGPFRAVQRAKARLRWTGAWYEVTVAIDPQGTEEPSPELLAEIRSYLEPYRRIGHDVVVAPAEYVSLDLALRVCVSSLHLRGHVEGALLDAFGTRTLPDGRRGFFYPDAWTFGDDVAVSAITAAAQAVPGVDSVQVTRLSRYHVGTPPQPPFASGVPPQLPVGGVLRLGAFEIARLDADPNFPEHGRLVLELCGGR